MNKIIKFSLAVFCIFSFQNSFSAMSDSFGIGARNVFLGGAADITDGGAYSSKGNPASLTKIKKTLMDTTFQLNSPNLKDTEHYISEPTSSGLGADGYSAANAENMYGLNFGMTLPLGPRFAFGVSGVMPAMSFAKVYAYSGKESNYLHYMDRQARPEIFTSLGIKLWEPLSIGIGAFFSLSIEGTIQAGMSETDQENRTVLDLKPILIPLAGILYTHKLNENEEFIFGATYRAEHTAEADLKIDIRVGMGEDMGTLPVQAQSLMMAFYDPARVGLGLGYKNEKVGAYLGFENVLWSSFKPNVMNMNNGIFRGLGTGELGRNPITLKNSFNLRSGFELKKWAPIFNGHITSQAGFEFKTSSLPKNPTSLAIVDSHKSVVNIGSGFAFPKIEKVLNFPLTLNLGFKWTHLFNEDYAITNVNGGLQTASIGGNVYSFITGVKVEI